MGCLGPNLRSSTAFRPTQLPKRWPLAVHITRTRRGTNYRFDCSAKGPSDEEPSTSGRTEPPAAPASRPCRFPFLPIAALAGVGLAETAYLTYTKLVGSSVACPLSTACASVLTSEYASLWGIIPLSAAGMLAYGVVTALALSGHSAAQRDDADTEAPLRTAVLAGGLLLGTTSAYLMYILVTAFPGEACPWCIGSAALSASIVALAASGLPKRELEDAAAPGAGLAAATLLVLSLGLGTPDASQAGTGITELEYKQPVVTTESSSQAVSLARRLREAGAKMYGAFWCSHCYDQKQEFGREAMAEFPYVECFPEGWRQGVEIAPACKEANLSGFPTWVIGGERFEGEQSLDVLEAALAKLGGQATAAVTQ